MHMFSLALIFRSQMQCHKLATHLHYTNNNPLLSEYSHSFEISDNDLSFLIFNVITIVKSGSVIYALSIRI